MMTVGIFLPTQIYWQGEKIAKLTAEGLEGSFTLLPRHIDYASVLVPGILTVEEGDGGIGYFAVDHGTLLKVGSEVRISTRNAVRGEEIVDLARVVAEEFQALDELEKKARTALTGLEHTMLRRFAELKKG